VLPDFQLGHADWGAVCDCDKDLCAAAAAAGEAQSPIEELSN